VSHGLPEHPREEDPDGQPDELNPAWDLDPRRTGGGGAHGFDRTTGPGPSRPPAWEWSFAEDGTLALDPSRLWDEPPRRRLAAARLYEVPASGTVLRMPPPSAQTGRGGRAVRARRQRRDDVQRRRLAVLVAIGVVAIGTLLVTAFGGGDHPTGAIAAPASAARLLPAGPPSEEAIARLGSLTLDLPVNQHRMTAIGYFAASDGALALTPIGTQANQGLLRRLAHAVFGGGGGSPRWYLLPGGEGPSTSALDVGAAPGTDVYSPVTGTVIGITPVVIDGKVYGQRIDIQPLSAPSLVVSVSDLAADQALIVGSHVTQGSTKVGGLLDLSKVEKQALSRYTNDEGNHVLVEVHAAAMIDLR
jgi:hypothetical protein